MGKIKHKLLSVPEEEIEVSEESNDLANDVLEELMNATDGCCMNGVLEKYNLQRNPDLGYTAKRMLDKRIGKKNLKRIRDIVYLDICHASLMNDFIEEVKREVPDYSKQHNAEDEKKLSDIIEFYFPLAIGIKSVSEKLRGTGWRE